MTTITSYQINEAVLAFIAEELGQRYKQFSNSAPTREMLLSWAADAERSLKDGNGAEFDIRAWNTISDKADLVQLYATNHFRAKQQKIE